MDGGHGSWLEGMVLRGHDSVKNSDGGHSSWMEGTVLGWRAWFLNGGCGSWMEGMVL